MTRPDMSLRVNVFLVAVMVIILGQAIYSYHNLHSFRTSYIQALQDKSRGAGMTLQADIQNILNLGIPLRRLARFEQRLSRALEYVPEIAFIEIVDADQHVLYFADHEQARPVEPGTVRSRFTEARHIEELARLGLAPEDTDIAIPLVQNDSIRGFVHIHVSGLEIHSKSRQILWDMLTVMLTSLLLTFEFLTFFVIYQISHPLMLLQRDIAKSFRHARPVRAEQYASLGRIGVLANSYNQIIRKCSKSACSALNQQQTLDDLRQSLNQSLPGRGAGGGALNLESGPVPDISGNRSDVRAGLAEQCGECLNKAGKQLDNLRQSLCWPDVPKRPTALRADDEAPSIPCSLIRPLIFLFVMADGFSLSFFPMYVDSMFQPVFGLSREMVISLPLSAFMLVMAVSLPLSGAMTDSRGWRRPMLAGLALNAVGHALTAVAQDITQLIVFRSFVAVGFGMVFMCCQRFVVDYTNLRTRAMGMAGFLAAFFSGDICGTVIGAMLAERIGYADVFYVSALFAGLALVFALAVFRGQFRPEETANPTAPRMTFRKEHMFKVFQDREFRSLVLLQAIPAKMILVGFLFFFTPLYLNSLDALQSNIGRIIMCYNICLIFIGPLISYLFPQERLRGHLVLLGGLITAGALLSFAFASGTIPVLVLVILLGVAHSFSVSAQASLVSETRIVREMGPGAAMGIFRFWERTGNVAGPLVMAFLIARLGFVNSVVMLGAVSLACSLLYLFTIAARREKT